MSASDIKEFHQAFDSEDYSVPPIEVIVTENRKSAHGHCNLIHIPSAFKADIFFVGDSPWANDALQRRRQEIANGGETIWIASPEDVILSKLQYLQEGGSVKHITDIQDMLAVQENNIDRDFIGSRVEVLGLQKEWSRVIEGDKKGT